MNSCLVGTLGALAVLAFIIGFFVAPIPTIIAGVIIAVIGLVIFAGSAIIAALVLAFRGLAYLVTKVRESLANR